MLTKEHKEEIDKIKSKLLFQEKVEAVAKQSTYTRHAPMIPSIVFVTSHRIIEKKCYPLKPKFVFMNYDQIISVEHKKGIIKSSVVLILPGEKVYFDALDKDEAAFMADVINNYIKKFIEIKERQKPRNLIRKYFSEEIQEATLRKQNHRCASCDKILKIVEFDHIDGNRSDNSVSNCQALCPNCHAYKTRTSR